MRVASYGACKSGSNTKQLCDLVAAVSQATSGHYNNLFNVCIMVMGFLLCTSWCIAIFTYLCLCVLSCDRLLLGNRPYWWVWLHTDWPHLLHQSPSTCETGPGVSQCKTRLQCNNGGFVTYIYMHSSLWYSHMCVYIYTYIVCTFTFKAYMWVDYID